LNENDILMAMCYSTKPSHPVCRPAYLVPAQARINWEGFARKGIRRKIVGMAEVGVPPHAYANRRWGNRPGMQHNPVLGCRVVLGRRVVLMMT